MIVQVNIADYEHPYTWDGVYCFALSDYPRITSWELKKLLTFMEYEKQHGRQTEIICEDETILAAVNNAVAHNEFKHIIQPEIKNKINYLSQDGLGLLDWSEKVYNFIEGLN